MLLDAARLNSTGLGRFGLRGRIVPDLAPLVVPALVLVHES
ncbi:MAG: hypothetical protein WEA57_00410 [Acidimicrobiia bacterium]